MKINKKSKMKKVLKKIIRIFVAVFTISTLIVAGYFTNIWFNKTDMFNLKKIIVKNEYLISKGEIIELSELKGGIRVFNIDTNEVENIIAKSSYIDNVSISIIYPATVVISVIEEKPIAYCLKENRLKFIDDSGVVMGYVSAEKSLDLPIILDKKINDDIVKFLNISRGVSEFVYHKISDISYSRKNGIIISLVDKSSKVIIGEGNFDKKILVLENFLRDMNTKIKFENTQYIDLRFENQVVVKESDSKELEIKEG